METILLVYSFGDFDSHNVIAIATDKEAAIKLMTRHANKFKGPWPKSRIEEVSENKFRREPCTLDSSEYHYWIKEVKKNTLL